MAIQSRIDSTNPNTRKGNTKVNKSKNTYNKNEVEISKKKKENYELLKKQAARRAAENATKKGSADIINRYVNPKKKES
jgi:hypothetical protein